MRILFLYPLWGHQASFIVNDREILSRHFQVTPLHYDPKDLLFPARLAKHLRGKDLVFSWFGGIHTVWAWLIGRALGVPQVIVAGGYDVAHLPEIGYGLREETKFYPLVVRSFKAARKVLAVSEDMKGRLEALGIRDSVVVYNGVAMDHFLPREKQGYVLSMGRLVDGQIRRKGLVTFKEAARLLPDVPFRLVGGGDPSLSSAYLEDAPPNFDYLGELPHEQVVEQVAKASVYCQLSFYESFGVALVEAMAAGCVPVVTDRGALPEVVGPGALVVPYGDAETTSRMIRTALLADDGGVKRSRAMDCFSLQRREALLIREIEAAVATP